MARDPYAQDQVEPGDSKVHARLMEELCEKLGELLALARQLGVDAPAAELPAVVTVDEVAELLQIDRKSVYSAIHRGEIPGVLRVGRTIRISREAIVRWIRRA